jgi:signal recognition particle GTPase
MEIFDEVVEETSSESYNEMCKRNVEKKYRRGYSQFLAELIKNNIMDTDTFMKIILKIINQVELNRARKESIKLTEEFADCLMKIMKAIYTDARVDSDEDESEQRVHIIRATLKDLAPRIQQLSVRDPDAVGLSSKARFTFMDIYEGIQKM